MLKKLIRNIVLREKASSQKYVSYLRKQGVQIGEDVTVYSPTHTLIDLSQPCLLKIGNHVRITHGVIILTHDYSWSVLKQLPEHKGQILGAQSPVVIGNNVFIGMNAVITRGVTIGDNVIIGAGSVVTKDCKSNCVYAGVPAKEVMTVSDFYAKRETAQFKEACQMAHAYQQCYGEKPPKEVFSEYFMLFCSAEDASKNEVFRRQMETGMGYEASYLFMKARVPMFPDYEAFLTACYSESQ